MTNDFDPRTYYIALLQDIDISQLQHDIVRYLADNGYFGSARRCTREQLCVGLFGRYTRNHDRKIRKAKQGTMILSSSGSRGYFLPSSQSEIDTAIKENVSRINALQHNNEILLGLKLPIVLPPDPTATQISLF